MTRTRQLANCLDDILSTPLRLTEASHKAEQARNTTEQKD